MSTVALVPSSNGLSHELAKVLTDAELPIISESWSPHDRARGRHAAVARARGYEYALWVDDDMVPTVADCKTLIERTKAYTADIMTGVYVCRHAAANGQMMLNFAPEEPGEIVLGKNGKVLPICVCGFGFLVMRLAALDSLCSPPCRYESVFGAAWFLPTVVGDAHLGEDRSFSVRANQVGLRMFVDCSVVVGHVGKKVYYPWNI